MASEKNSMNGRFIKMSTSNKSQWFFLRSCDTSNKANTTDDVLCIASYNR